MAKKNSLFLLIKSLTPAEKRYFKLFARMNQRDQNYLLLFEALDKQQYYDETVLKRKLEKHAFSKHLHVTKNYLIHLILKSLRNYHSQLSKTAELKDLLRDVEILFQKEQYDMCGEVLEKARKMAGEYERFADLLEIFDWQRRLALATGDAIESKRAINAILSKERETLTALENLSEQWRLANNIYDEIQSLRNGSNANTGLPTALQRDKSFEYTRINILYYFNLQSFFFFNGNLSAAHVAADKLLQMLEDHTEYVRNDPATLITALNNKIGLCLQSRDYETARRLLSTIRRIPQAYRLKNTWRISPKVLLQSYNMELEMYRDTGDVEQGLHLAAEISGFLMSLPAEAYPDYRLVLCYQGAYFCYLDRRFDRAMQWLNDAFAVERLSVREDILSFAHFLRMIIHFELQNFTVLKYSVEACRRFLKKKRDLHPFERQLLRFFAKASIAETAERRALLQDLQSTLFEDTSLQQQRSALDYLDFHTWIDRALSS